MNATEVDRLDDERRGAEADREIASRAYQMRDDAERKALDSLARYKFEMFGYWAAIWVDTNRIIGDKRPSPFRGLVRLSRELKGADR